APPEEAPPRKYVPVVADFLRAAAKEFNFVPQQPRSEMEYKRVYAKTASAAGLTKEQAVRIYAFESGGDGAYDVQAGRQQPAQGAQGVSPPPGDNQLLAPHSREPRGGKGGEGIRGLWPAGGGVAEGGENNAQDKA